MKWTSTLLILILCLLIHSPARAVDWHKLFCVPWCVADCPQPKCCDDYCPKPIPCVPEIRCFTCDDYCPKCEPCTKKICCFGCDDYCNKCPPKITCPPRCDLKCVPTSTPCARGCGACAQGAQGSCAQGSCAQGSCTECQAACDQH